MSCDPKQELLEDPATSTLTSVDLDPSATLTSIKMDFDPEAATAGLDLDAAGIENVALDLKDLVDSIYNDKVLFPGALPDSPPDSSPDAQVSLSSPISTNSSSQLSPLPNNPGVLQLPPTNQQQLQQQLTADMPLRVPDMFPTIDYEGPMQMLFDNVIEQQQPQHLQQQQSRFVGQLQQQQQQQGTNGPQIKMQPDSHGAQVHLPSVVLPTRGDTLVQNNNNPPLSDVTLARVLAPNSNPPVPIAIAQIHSDHQLGNPSPVPSAMQRSAASAGSAGSVGAPVAPPKAKRKRKGVPGGSPDPSAELAPEVNPDLVKTEPGTAPADQSYSQPRIGPLSSSGPGTGTSIGSGTSTSTGICGPTPSPSSIRFQEHQPSTWAHMVSRTLQELPRPNLNAVAEKGFNFSTLDDAFIVQKKNHFQVTCHIQAEPADYHYVRMSDGSLKEISRFQLNFYGVKSEVPSSYIRVEQSQADRSKVPFYPMPVSLREAGKPLKLSVGRMHFTETTANNMRKKGKPNPAQKYFQLVVSLQAVVAADTPLQRDYPLVSLASDRIIVRASNPGQFEPDQEGTWTREPGGDVVYHIGKVGINTDQTSEALAVHGNIQVSGQILQPSDIRIKKAVTPLDSRAQFENVQKLKIVQYQYRKEYLELLPESQRDEMDLQLQTGVIAQDVEQVLPEAVMSCGPYTLNNGREIDNMLIVNKDRLFLENIGAVHELSKMTGNLEDRIDTLEKVNETVVFKLSRLKKTRNSITSFNSTSSTSSIYSITRTKEKHKCKGDRCRRPQSIFKNRYVQMLIVTLMALMCLSLLTMTVLFIFGLIEEEEIRDEHFWTGQPLGLPGNNTTSGISGTNHTTLTSIVSSSLSPNATTQYPNITISTSTTLTPIINKMATTTMKTVSTAVPSVLNSTLATLTTLALTLNTNTTAQTKSTSGQTFTVSPSVNITSTTTVSNTAVFSKEHIMTLQLSAAALNFTQSPQTGLHGNFNNLGTTPLPSSYLYLPHNTTDYHQPPIIGAKPECIDTQLSQNCLIHCCATPASPDGLDSQANTLQNIDNNLTAPGSSESEDEIASINEIHPQILIVEPPIKSSLKNPELPKLENILPQEEKIKDSPREEKILPVVEREKVSPINDLQKLIDQTPELDKENQVVDDSEPSDTVSEEPLSKNYDLNEITDDIEANGDSQEVDVKDIPIKVESPIESLEEALHVEVDLPLPSEENSVPNGNITMEKLEKNSSDTVRELGENEVFDKVSQAPVLGTNREIRLLEVGESSVPNKRVPKPKTKDDNDSANHLVQLAEQDSDPITNQDKDSTDKDDENEMHGGDPYLNKDSVDFDEHNETHLSDVVDDHKLVNELPDKYSVKVTSSADKEMRTTEKARTEEQRAKRDVSSLSAMKSNDYLLDNTVRKIRNVDETEDFASTNRAGDFKGTGPHTLEPAGDEVQFPVVITSAGNYTLEGSFCSPGQSSLATCRRDMSSLSNVSLDIPISRYLEDARIRVVFPEHLSSSITNCPVQSHSSHCADKEGPFGSVSADAAETDLSDSRSFVLDISSRMAMLYRFRYRISSEVDTSSSVSNLCAMPSSQVGADYKEYNLNFHRVCHQ